MKESRYNVWVDHADATYVFNGVSGALLRMSQEDVGDVRSFVAGEGSGSSPGLLEQLTRGRMLVGDDSDELQLLKTRYQLSRYDRTHLGLTIVTSLGCNFDCPYCFEAKHPSILGEGVQEAILDLLDDSLPHIRDFTVTWFGGEPLVGKRPLLALSAAFIERCDRADVAYTADITTNGWLLDEQTCRELRDSRVTSAQVCLDGPPEVHDRMRPYVDGRPTFWRIVQNLKHAVDYIGVAVRMNVDRGNLESAEGLLQILEAEGLAGKIIVYPGQIVAYAHNTEAPSASYQSKCFSNADYAQAERDFLALATRYGFAGPSLPSPVGAPCTAVRANELVIDSSGELYKCWDDVGNPRSSVGDIRNYRDTNGRLARWLRYDPFADEECRGCIALPVCMGGCAHHGMDISLYDNRCGTFRHSYKEQVLAYAEASERKESTGAGTPVALTRRKETR